MRIICLMDTEVIRLADADEIKDFYLEATGMLPGYTQLSAGKAGMIIHTAELCGVTLIWARVEGSTRWEDQFSGDGVHLGYALESEGSIRVRGHELSGHEAMVWMAGQSMDYVMHGPVITLEISVSQDLVDQLGWQIRGGPLGKVGRKPLRHLNHLCRLACRADSNQVIAWRDRILTTVEFLLQDWSFPTHSITAMNRPTRHYQLIQQVDRYFHTLQAEERLSVDQLAQNLGVPRRTLFHAYRSLMGIGPRQFLELKRLQTLRSALKAGSAASTTVTQLAYETGFVHMGRLAARYRAYFGENPSTTLKTN